MNVLPLLMLLTLGLVLYVLALIAMTAWMLTHPPRRAAAWAMARSLPSDPGELDEPLEFSEWTFVGCSGKTLPVWDIVGRDARGGGPVFVLTHGWGDSRVVSLPRVVGLATVASRIIVWDMPGHANAPGSCALGLREVDDLLALLRQIGPTDRPVVLAGFSLGAGVSIEAAAYLSSTGASPTPVPRNTKKGLPRIAGVIAEAPYRLPVTPAERVLASRNYPRRLNLRLALALVGLARTGTPFMAKRFDRAYHAAKLDVPLLVIHGEHDTISPLEDGRRIAAAVPNARGMFVEIAAAGHADIWTNPVTREQALAAVQTFLHICRERGDAG